MLTIVPLARSGELLLMDDKGNRVGEGFARASYAQPGYVTIIAVEELPDGKKISHAFRVPADWLLELSLL